VAKFLVIKFDNRIFYEKNKNLKKKKKIFWKKKKKKKKKSHWINGGDPTIANKTTNFFGQHPKKI